MKLYQTINQISFAIATEAGTSANPFAGYPEVWDGDKCRWEFPMIPPIGSIIDMGRGTDPAGPRRVHRVKVERYDFEPLDGRMVLVLVTSKV